MPIPIPAILAALSAAPKIAQSVTGFVDAIRGKAKQEARPEVLQALDVVAGYAEEKKDDPEFQARLMEYEEEMARIEAQDEANRRGYLATIANSQDKFVRRARPSWIYGGLLVVIVDFCIFPVFKVKVTDYVDPAVMKWFLTIVGGVVLGISYLRSGDKAGAKPPFMK